MQCLPLPCSGASASQVRQGKQIDCGPRHNHRNTAQPCSSGRHSRCWQALGPSSSPGLRWPAWRTRTITAAKFDVATAMGDEDLLQFPDRLKWYEAKFCADDMPDWNEAKFVGSRDVAPGLRAITLEVEISRERIPLRAAYKSPGQKASVRAKGNVNRELTVSSPPFSQEMNKHPLFLVRGDLFAYEIKTAREPVSVKAELEVLVGEREAPELWHLEEGDEVEVGPFQGTGLDLKGSGILAIYRFPTVIMFVSGKGIATARALLEATTDVPSLNCNLRKEVRIYYQARNESGLVFKERWPVWTASAAQPSGCKLEVVATTRATFQQAFDDDDELMYDPNYTAAVILTGGDEEADAAAREVCREAEISVIVSDKSEAEPVEHLDSTPAAFRKWARDHAN